MEKHQQEMECYDSKPKKKKVISLWNLERTPKRVAPTAIGARQMHQAVATRKLVPGTTNGIDSIGGGTGVTHCSTVPFTTKPAAAPTITQREACLLPNQRQLRNQKEPTKTKTTKEANQLKRPSPPKSTAQQIAKMRQ